MYDLTKSNFDALKSTEKIINGLSDETLTVVALSATTEKVKWNKLLKMLVFLIHLALQMKLL